MERKDIPTLTELIDKATDHADYAFNLESPDMIVANALTSIAYSQVAIARTQGHQKDLMVAMLRTLSHIEAKVTQYADAYSSAREVEDARSTLAESVALWTPSES